MSNLLTNTKIRRTRLACAVLLALAVQGAAAESLPEVFGLARQSDPKYKAARYEFEAVGLSVEEARAALLPTASFEVTRSSTEQFIYSSQNAVFGSGRSQFPTGNRTLSIVQPIFRLNAIRRFFQTDALTRQAAATFADAEQDLVLRTATAYLAVLASQDALAFARAERAAIARNLDLVQQRYNSGLVTIVNLYDARARLEVKDSDLTAVQNDLDDKLQALVELTGRKVTGLTALPPNLAFREPEPRDPQIWVDAAIKNNLAVTVRSEAAEVARQEIGRQRGALYPAVDLSLNSNRKNTGGSLFGGGSDVRNTELMLRVNVPIFDGNLARTLANQAERRFLGAQEDIERERRQAERQTRAAYQSVMSGITRVRALDQSVVSFESARRLKDEGYKAGLGTVLAVLDAERDLYAAKRDAAQARYDYVLNTLRLKQVTGGLREADLQDIGAALPAPAAAAGK